MEIHLSLFSENMLNLVYHCYKNCYLNDIRQMQYWGSFAPAGKYLGSNFLLTCLFLSYQCLSSTDYSFQCTWEEIAQFSPWVKQCTQIHETRWVCLNQHLSCFNQHGKSTLTISIHTYNHVDLHFGLDKIDKTCYIQEK